jgi:hypothetical protein
MAAHPWSEDVQGNGCFVVAWLAKGHAENQVLAGEAAGAVQAVVAALKAHRGSEAVQGNGCFAIVSLARGHAGNVAAAIAAGGVEAAAAAVRSGADGGWGRHALEVLDPDHALLPQVAPPAAQVYRGY